MEPVLARGGSRFAVRTGTPRTGLSVIRSRAVDEYTWFGQARGKHSYQAGKRFSAMPLRNALPSLLEAQAMTRGIGT